MKKDNLELVQASDDDFIFFYGTIPTEKYCAYVGILNNVKIGIGGYVTDGIMNTLFLHIPNSENYAKITIWRFLKKALAMLKQKNLSFNAIRDKHIETSLDFLTKLGFTLQYVSGDKLEVWQWDQTQ
jgi:hypothetical protein